jgi:hypothetical protein
VLDFEADSIRLAITAKRHRRKPIDPEASQFEDSIGVFSPDGTLNCWVCMKCNTRKRTPRNRPHQCPCEILYRLNQDREARGRRICLPPLGDRIAQQGFKEQQSRDRKLIDVWPPALGPSR